MNHELFMVHDSNRESWIMKRELKYERLKITVSYRNLTINKEPATFL